MNGVNWEYDEPKYLSNWSLQLIGNPSIGLDAANQRNFHINFSLDDFGDYNGGTPYLSSPHVNMISMSDPYRAKIRLEVLLKIFNGIRTVLDYPTYLNGKDLYLKQGDRFTLFSNTRPIENRDDFDIKEEGFNIVLEELSNPFNPDLVSYLENKRRSYNIASDSESLMFDRASKDDMYRDVLIWRALCAEDRINFIANAYKILDTLRTYCDKNNLNKIDHPFVNAVKSFRDEYKTYMNIHDYCGIVSRHGHDKNPISQETKSKITFKKIESDLNELILHWTQYLHDKDIQEQQLGLDNVYTVTIEAHDYAEGLSTSNETKNFFDLF